jgi:hypothetical protein
MEYILCTLLSYILNKLLYIYIAVVLVKGISAIRTIRAPRGYREGSADNARVCMRINIYIYMCVCVYVCVESDAWDGATLWEIRKRSAGNGCGGGAKNKSGSRRQSAANGLRVYTRPSGLPPDKYTCIINNIYIYINIRFFVRKRRCRRPSRLFTQYDRITSTTRRYL